MAKPGGKELGDFLRSRRARISAADVGLPGTGVRRVPGLRRDEVARLAAISTEYYVEIEQGRSAPPSAQALLALAEALRLSQDERAHLLQLAGYHAPARSTSLTVDPALNDLHGRLGDVPAQIQTDLWQVLAQNALAEAILGRLPIGAGTRSNVAYHWFNGGELQLLFRPEERDQFSRTLTADLRATLGRRPNDTEARALISQIKAVSDEFLAFWKENDVGIRRREAKVVAHPDGTLHSFTIHRIANLDQTQHLIWLAPLDGPIDQNWPITVALDGDPNGR